MIGSSRSCTKGILLSNIATGMFKRVRFIPFTLRQATKKEKETTVRNKENKTLLMRLLLSHSNQNYDSLRLNHDYLNIQLKEVWL